MQAECLGHALRAWRRQWKGSNREYCAGALIWQLNDCWPATSWSIVDYYLRPKLAYYMVKRELAPITVGMKRSVGTSRSHGAQTLPPKESPAAAGEDLNSSQQQLRQSQKQNDGETIELWGSNLSLEGHTVDVIVRAWNIASGEEVVVPDIMPRRLPGIALPPNRSTEIAKFDVPGALGLVKEPQQDAKAEEGREVKKEQTSAEQTAAQIATVVVVTAYLVSRTDGSVLARAVNWPEPLKHVPLQEEARNLRVTLSQDASQVTVTADVPVKGLTLGALPHHHGEGGGDGGGGGEEKEDDAAFADNCVDIVPGEETTIGVTGLKPDMSRLIVWHLGMVSRCRPTGGESMFGSKSRQ
jgi:beta-mannosidase